MEPKLAARVGETRDGGFLEYTGDRVEEFLNWSPTTPGEVEALNSGRGDDNDDSYDNYVNDDNDDYDDDGRNRIFEFLFCSQKQLKQTHQEDYSEAKKHQG